ncbi:MAG: putative ABC transporter permease [Clostridiales bacterium]|nr:putative ABC transporter permease [Clostridiales bacterium]
MNIFLIFAFLFFAGSTCGWGLEVVFRRFFSKNNPSKKWVNPGFLNGTYLPIYGFGLCALYAMTMLEKFIYVDNAVVQRLILFIMMAAAMTAIEYIAGIIFIKGMRIKLWDYSEEWGNVQGIICPKFSFFWAVLSAMYYFLIHPQVLDGIRWLSENLAFSFFIGLFFGVFIIDVSYSLNLIVKICRFAEENKIIVKYEHLKDEINSRAMEGQKNVLNFLLQFRSELTLKESLEAHLKHLKRK